MDFNFLIARFILTMLLYNSNNIKACAKLICCRLVPTGDFDARCECGPYHLRCISTYPSKVLTERVNVDSTHLTACNSNNYITKLNIEFDEFDTNVHIHTNIFTDVSELDTIFLVNVNTGGKLPNVANLLKLREITIQNSNLIQVNNLEDLCKNENNLLHKIDFSINELTEQASSGSFDYCTRVNLLDLSYNKISSLENLFGKRINLKILNLASNRIESLNEFDFKHLPELTELTLSKNMLNYMHRNAFESLTKLKRLYLDKNNLRSLPVNSVIFETLKEFSVQDNPNLIDFPNAHAFKSLSKLTVHYSYHCCSFRILKTKNVAKQQISNTTNRKQVDDIIIAQKYNGENADVELEKDSHESVVTKIISSNDVSCMPDPDTFQPCENLLEDVWLSIAVWVISTLGILSNMCVIVHNVMYMICYYQMNDSVKVSTYLLSNLAVADLLMSIFLLFIAVKDAESRHNFFQSALMWQRSFRCNLAGFLGIASSVSSALCLAFITFERYYGITYSINYNKRVNIRVAVVITFCIWVASFFVASMPLFKINSYSAYAVILKCIVILFYSDFIVLRILALFCLQSKIKYNGIHFSSRKIGIGHF